MGKVKLQTPIEKMTGKLSKRGTICFRETPSGGVSIYEFETLEKIKDQLPSPATAPRENCTGFAICQQHNE